MSLERFATDENFNNIILRGLKRRKPELDILRIQDTELYQADDPTILNWITEQNRILLTHDAKTIPKYAYERLDSGLFTTGLFIVNDQMAIGQAIEELLISVEVTEPEEWHNTILYLPL